MPPMWTQERRRLQIATPLGTDALLLTDFQGTEGISALFSFDAHCLSEEATHTFADIVGKNVTVSIQTGNGSRYFNGIVSRFAQSGTVGDHAVFRAQIVPMLWMATRSTDCRIFQNVSVPDIVRQILEEYGITDTSFRLHGSYDPREYCVQYRETDYNFIARLLEEEGIFFFFVHEDGRHTLVLADHPAEHRPCPDLSNVRFMHENISGQEEDVVSWFQREQEIRASMYTATDYNMQLPSLDLVASATGTDAAECEIYDFPGGPGGVALKRDYMERLVRIRQQEESAHAVICSGGSYVRTLTPGCKFTMAAEGERSPFDGTYTLTNVHHRAHESYDPNADDTSLSYENRFDCIDTRVPFRPARVTARPTIMGVQPAVVVGPDGEEIHVDKYGRVKVLFFWDREGKRNKTSSCWLRVSHPWAGRNWGSISLPRIGQEVLVSFVEGDPDQPVITGRVYNGEQMPPYELPKYQTMSTMKSFSSKGGKGFNEFRFEDDKGKEQVFIHSQKRMDIRVRQSFYETNSGSRHTIVGWEDPDTGKQGGDYNVTVGNDYNLHVKGGRYERAEKKFNASVGADVVLSHEATEAVLVTGKKELNAQEIIFEAKTKIGFKVGPSFITIEPSGITIYGPMVKVNSGGYGAETGDPTIEDPLDAALADDGTPGFVERHRGRGGKRRSRKLRSQHYVAPPRPGEDPRMTAIRNTLQHSATGRHALEVYDRYGITPTFNSGGTAYSPAGGADGNKVNMDPSRTDPATSFVHEMNHAQNDHEGTSANVNTQSRSDYINQQLAEDAHGERLAYQTEQELADAGHPEHYNSSTGAGYRQDYQNGRTAEAARNPNATEAQLDRAGHDAAENRLNQNYQNGNINTGNTSPPQSYVDYWGSDWDAHHPPASGTP